MMMMMITERENTGGTLTVSYQRAGGSSRRAGEEIPPQHFDL